MPAQDPHPTGETASTPGSEAVIADGPKDHDAQSHAAWLVRESSRTIEVCERLFGITDVGESYSFLPQLKTLLIALRDFADVWNFYRKEADTPSVAPARYKKLAGNTRALLRDLRVLISAAAEMGIHDDEVDNSIRDVINKLADAISIFTAEFADLTGVRQRLSPDGLIRVREARDVLNDTANSVRIALISRSASAVQEIHDQARQVLQDTRQAAGEVGSLSLGKYFEEYARRERAAADRLRIWSLVTILATTAAAALILFFAGQPTSPSAASGWARIAIALPLAALAGYLGREAGRHRRVANWAAQREVQLMTLEAYAAPMDESDRKKLRADLGQRIFGVDLPDSFAQADSPSVGTEVTRLLNRRSSATSTSSLSLNSPRVNPDSSTN